MFTQNSIHGANDGPAQHSFDPRDADLYELSQIVASTNNTMTIADFLRYPKTHVWPYAGFRETTGILVPRDGGAPFLQIKKQGKNSSFVPLQGAPNERLLPSSPLNMTIHRLASCVRSLSSHWIECSMETLHSVGVIKTSGGGRLFHEEPRIPQYGDGQRLITAFGRIVLTDLGIDILSNVLDGRDPVIKLKRYSIGEGPPLIAIVEVKQRESVNIIGYLPAESFSATLMTVGRILTFDEARDSQKNEKIRGCR